MLEVGNLICINHKPGSNEKYCRKSFVIITKMKRDSLVIYPIKIAKGFRWQFERNVLGFTAEDNNEYHLRKVISFLASKYWEVVS